VTRAEFDRLVEATKSGRLSRRDLILVAGFAGAAAVLAACSSSLATLAPTVAPTAPPSAAPTPGTSPSGSAAASASAAAVSCDLPTAALAGAPTSVGDSLAIYNWASYLNPDDKALFGKLYNVSNITEDNYPSNEDMLAKLQAGGTGQYDIVAPTGYMIEIMNKSGLAEPLDLSKIPNYQYVDDRFKNLPFDTAPGGPHYVAKDWGTTGFGYRSKLVTEKPTSWADFWRLTMGPYSGKVSVLDSSPEVIGAALKKNGFSYNSVDPKELDIALNDLLALKPHLAAITSTYVPKVEAGDYVMALGWNGDFASVKSNKGSEDAVYVIPSEGTEFWVDTWAIPKDAPHPDAAHAFINFILQPSVQGKETNYTYYATPESSAIPCVDPTLSGDPSVFPDPATLSKLEAAKDLGEGTKLRDEIWTKFKSA